MDEHEQKIKLFYTLITPKEYEFILEHGLQYIGFSHNYRPPKDIQNLFIKNTIDLPVENNKFISLEDSTREIMNFIIESGINAHGGNSKDYLSEHSFYHCVKTLIRVICYAPNIEPSYLLIKNLKKPIDEIMQKNSVYKLSNLLLLPSGPMFFLKQVHYLMIIFMHDLRKVFSDYVSFFTEADRVYWNQSESEYITPHTSSAVSMIEQKMKWSFEMYKTNKTENFSSRYVYKK